jgi:ATP-dependent Zn protease
MAIEIPKYKVIKREGNCELRQYDTYITASVEVNGKDYNIATSQGFRYLADYIFGNNTKRSNISMTAPVLQEEKPVSEKITMTAPVSIIKGENTYKISFVMPNKYTLETLPLPNNSKVILTKVSTFKAAVISFSGLLNEKIITKKTEELKKWIKLQKLKDTNVIQIARYNPPWTLWFLRRNEILINLS